MSNEECREFIRQDLAWLANFLRVNFKMDVKEIRARLREMLTVTV